MFSIRPRQAATKPGVRMRMKPARATSSMSWASSTACIARSKPGRSPLKRMLATVAAGTLASVTGSAYAPMLVIVTPVVDWQTSNTAEIKAAETSLPRFLLTHPGLDRTIGALSVLP